MIEHHFLDHTAEERLHQFLFHAMASRKARVLAPLGLFTLDVYGRHCLTGLHPTHFSSYREAPAQQCDELLIDLINAARSDTSLLLICPPLVSEISQRAPANACLAQVHAGVWQRLQNTRRPVTKLYPTSN